MIAKIHVRCLLRDKQGLLDLPSILSTFHFDDTNASNCKTRKQEGKTTKRNTHDIPTTDESTGQNTFSNSSHYYLMVQCESEQNYSHG